MLDDEVLIGFAGSPDNYVLAEGQGSKSFDSKRILF
jgi:hypothetical protein